MAIEERSTFEIQAEEIARKFHETYERYAPQHGWETQERSRVLWNDVPPENRSLMVAVVKKLLIDNVIKPGKATDG